MTIVVGYLAGKSGDSAAAPRSWRRGRCGPADGRDRRAQAMDHTLPARIDAEYAAWADQLAADSATEAQRFRPVIGFRSGNQLPRPITPVGVGDSSKWSPLGAGAVGARILVGRATRDRSWWVQPRTDCFTSSPVPVTIARGDIAGRPGDAPGSPAVIPGSPESVLIVERAVAMARQSDGEVAGHHVRRPRPHRCIRRSRLHAEGLDPWLPGRIRPGRIAAVARSGRCTGDDVELQAVSGNGWDQALDDAEWIDGEVLAWEPHREPR